MRFCEWLEEQRKNTPMDRYHIAAAVDIAYSTFNKHLRGEVFPHINTFVLYCKFFEVPKEKWASMYYKFLEAEQK